MEFFMIKQIAWNTFKNTGDIHTMLELIEVEKAMESNQKNLEFENKIELLDVTKENSDS